MKATIFRITSYLKYKRRARHRRGFGIHSPFVFHLLNFVVYEKTPFYDYQKIESARKKMLQSSAVVDVVDFGTGRSGQFQLAKIAKRSLESPRIGQLLFRLVNFAKPQNVLELGTSLGITTMYLASPNKQNSVTTMEGCPAFCRIAQENFAEQGLSNITVVEGDIDKTLPSVLQRLPQLDFVYFDANHLYEPTMRYWNACLPKLHKKSVCVFDDIHHSAEMERAWNEIKAQKNVRVSLDLYHVGILFFDPEIPKQDYIIAF